MIHLRLPAEIACDHENCEASAPVTLILLASGGFGFKGPRLKAPWQVAVARQNPGGPFLCHCPKHATVIEPAPAILGVRTDAH